MTAAQRISLGLLLLALLLVGGLWMWLRWATTRWPSAAPPTATPGVVAPSTPTATPVHAPPGYRLAGVATGNAESFAAIEAPDGSHALYALNAAVPGLGTVVHIEDDRVVVRGAAGEFDLQVAPAASPTPTKARTVTTRPSPTRRVLRPTPRPAGAAPARGSSPSSAPDRPAS